MTPRTLSDMNGVRIGSSVPLNRSMVAIIGKCIVGYLASRCV
jgi:hypothetical protein